MERSGEAAANALLGKNGREAFALLASCIELRLVGQAFEWGYGRFDDRSGSENLTK